MKQQVDHHHSERSFQVGDQAFLLLQPYNNISLKEKGCQKLAPKSYGPYQVLQCIKAVAYKLALPTISKIHPVFHVSYLKKIMGNNCKVQPSLPELDKESSLWLHLKQFLVTSKRNLCRHTIKEALIKWKYISLEYETWELTIIIQQFQQFWP